MSFTPQIPHQKPSYAISILMLCLMLLACNRASATTGNPQDLLTGRIDITNEAKSILQKYSVLYYTKWHLGNKHTWAIERLNLRTGITKELITNTSSGISELVPYSISPDNNHLLFGGKKNNNRAIFELNLTTKKWNKISDNVIAGSYSPDGKLIGIYYKSSPLPFKKQPILRTGILDRNGNMLKSLSCKTSKCLHLDWTSNTDVIFSQENSGKELNQLHSQLISYSLSTNSYKTIFEAKKANQKISYPKPCNNKIYFLLKNKNESYIKQLHSLGHKTQLGIIDNKNMLLLNIIPDFNTGLEISCIRKNSRYLLVTRDTPILKYKPFEKIHIEIYDTQKHIFYRIFQKKYFNTIYLSPVLANKQYINPRPSEK